MFTFDDWDAIFDVQQIFLFSRGTDEFSLAVSKDNVNFTTVVTGNLPDARNMACGPDIPLVEFDINMKAEFVRVTLISYFGLASGLQYINFIFAWLDELDQ